MKSITAFMEVLDSKGVKLWVAQGQLRCRAPKGVLTEELRVQLSKHKAAILSLLERPVIPVSSRDSDVPLSFSQLRLWFLDQLEGYNSVYNMFFAVELQGPLDYPALERALNGVVHRHEILRTSFPDRSGEPRQQVLPLLTLALPLTDLTSLSHEEQAKTVQRLSDNEAQLPFDLSCCPLLRARLLRCDNYRHVLLVSMHHIISDGWSVGVMVRELGTLYTAFAANKTAQLPDLPLQYADFALWQRHRYARGAMAGQIEYWQQALNSIPQLLQLPLDAPRPPIQTFNGAVVRFQLEGQLSMDLHELSLKKGVTLFMSMLAGFGLLLHRLSGQDDLVIGSPIANRNRGELEGLIGFFVNTLALRLDCSGDPSFNELLERVARTARNAYDHQDLPFEHLVEILQPERSLSHSSVFQVMMIFQNTPEEELELGPLSIRQLEQSRVTAKFDLTLTLAEGKEGLAGELEYNRDLFEAESIERLAAQLQWLLLQVVAEPEKRLSRFSLVGKDDREYLTQWNATTADFPADACLHELIGVQTRSGPERIAVECDGRYLTYAELINKADKLAARLRHYGIGPGKLVGICLERNLDLPVALLGTLIAGGAYLPLDPGFPAERLAYMLADSQAPVLLSDSSLAKTLPTGDWRLLLLDHEPEDATGLTFPDEQGSRNKVTATDIAYVIYTSGSTGRPKGVMIEHRSLVNFLSSMGKVPGCGEDDRFLSVTTISFDIAALELFLPLLKGGRVILANREDTTDGYALQRLLKTRKVTIMQATPATWRLLQLSGWHPDSQLRILCGGEAMASELADYLQSGGGEVWNLYGPTETTIWSAVYRFGSRTRLSHNGIEPIGRPIDNTTIYVLDSMLQPVPLGVVGDLYIGGTGLARGYHNRPELNVERFIPDPFSTVTGARLYKTGDLARLAGDGQLEFLGRNDQQVKLRGFRIEPGEIENTLLLHEEVEGAVVHLCCDQEGEERLVAYLIPNWTETRDDTETGSQQLEQWQEIWNTAYDEADDAVASDPTFDLSGWTSSYTGLPIPDEEMKEWLQRCVARISALKPQRVLEIGVGSGMLLARLAPGCKRYLACDFSSEALDRIDRLRSRDKTLAHVELRQGAAHELADLPAASFDTLVLNSVIQYFPNAEYLLGVLAQALKLVCPSGAIFLGDLLDYTKIEDFHTSVQSFRGGADCTAEELKRRVAEAVDREEELFVDPAFFPELAARQPVLAGVDILPKEGLYFNEMNGFRYDTVLHLNDVPITTTPNDIKAHSELYLNYFNRPGQKARQEKQSTLLVDRVQRYLIDCLPQYMLPSGFVLLSQFPLTPNRKIDRAALPPLEEAVQISAGEYQAPATRLESTLARIWSELLGCEQVSVLDNFFALGGHSLLAARVMARLREELQRELNVRLLFEYPTVALLAGHLEEQAIAPAVFQPIKAGRRTVPLPLSFSQRRLWFLDQLLGANPSYNMPAVFELRGDLREDHLQTALQMLVDRHESLRTVFSAVDGHPQQNIFEYCEGALIHVDLSSLDDAEREKAVRQLAEEEAAQAFDLAQGPLLRTSLIHLGPCHHLLLLTMHHIISDLWSMGVLINELALFYNGLIVDQPPDMAPLPIQYADFAIWQHEQLQGMRLEQLVGYWKGQLESIPPCLELPTDLPRPPEPEYEGGVERFHIPLTLHRQLQTVIKSAGATPFMLYLAAFAVLLGRISGQQDVVIGTPVAGRDQQALEGLIGFFINTLPLRINLGSNQDFITLLQQVKETALEAYAHQDLPFELLVEQLRPERNPSHSPIFQVMLSYQNVELRQPEFTGLQIASLEQEYQAVKFDIVLFLSEGDHGVEGELKYRTDLFFKSTMARWCERFLVFLQGVADDAQRMISKLPLETASARQLLRTFNKTVEPSQRPENLLHLLGRAGQCYSQRPALTWDTGAMTYDEMGRRVRVAASYLRAKGVRRGHVVGLYLERSPAQVIGVLAILKSGAAYLPLDPQLPQQRLQVMISEAKVDAVLSQAELEQTAVEFVDSEKIPLLIMEKAQQEPDPAEVCEAPCRSEDPVCVLYTSGSTGRPKGVVITHGMICNYLRWAEQQLLLEPDDVILFKTPLGFDPSLWELFATLTSGARLVIAEPDGQRRPDYLLAMIRRHQVTQLRLVPTLLKMLLEDGRLGECSSLRRILCGGEVLTAELAAHLHQTIEVELYNLYGPTEACINATCCKVEPGAARVDIGRPVSNVTVRLLDGHGDEVPLGSIGEIHVGGACLSPGYLNQPELTNQKFVSTPFAEGRLYRTGDLGRFLDDGSILFSGRSDQQVKLRGYRIELEEIEAVLEKLPEISSAGVTVQPDSSGEPALTAYLEVTPTPRLEHVQLILAKYLPDYMRVGRFMLVEKLPRGINGKLLRRQLSELEAISLIPQEQSAGESFTEDTTEMLIARLMAELLDVEQVRRDDNFFTLGGHSLSATRLFARLRRHLEKEIPLRWLFTAPTPAGLAALVNQNSQSLTSLNTPQLKKRERVGQRPTTKQSILERKPYVE
ncbi:non-ribosomal peptide synthetase [Desulfopila sp. IMCC35008]|uniref:non-ribosomal peptide synthetase n=1 Tax=Desulfopila sp. IMCC35008 TaxID=2653858 RepID=UPI0013D7370E|nr:non-ribosomal peptide synthetase [Desulfopila sp. IMCC35008]